MVKFSLFVVLLLISSFNFGAVNVAAQPFIDPRQEWCVAKPSSSETELKNNIEYVCTEQGIDCTKIQENGKCFSPDTLINHASVVMNLYYQKFGRFLHNCDFLNSGLIVLTDPSYGGCQYTYA